MIFRFSTFNHCPQGKIIVEDITAIMGAQMSMLGHAVSFTEKPEFIGDGYNLVLESFADDPNTIALIAKAHADGKRFIFVATEEPTPSGFNHGLDPAMIDRQNAFVEAAKYCSGILHLVPGEHVTSWYSKLAPAAHSELGHAHALDDFEKTEPDHDFGFYGKMTWRREKMLDRIERTTGNPVLKITSLDLPRKRRDEIMGHARVILQIRANEEWGMVSSTRCATALFMGRPVVGEPHPYQKPWDDVVDFAPSVEQFFAMALATRLQWRKVHRRQLAKFRTRLTPDICIGAPLRTILGG